MATAAQSVPQLAPRKESVTGAKSGSGTIKTYYQNKIEAAELEITKKTQNLRRLEAQRNALNTRGTFSLARRHSRYVLPADSGTVRLLREELQVLQEPGSYVGEVIKVMGKKKVLVKVQPEGKYGASRTK
jgi:26S proteasome regulatory subunit T6